MRKIEQAMIEAIKLNLNEGPTNTIVFKSANTHIFRGSTGTLAIRLHGNTIAMMSPNSLKITSAGWETPTTKSRLNAILSTFTKAHIFQKNFDWYIQQGDTKQHFSGKSLLHATQGYTELTRSNDSDRYTLKEN